MQYGPRLAAVVVYLHPVRSLQLLHEPDMAEGRVEDVAGAGLGVQHPHHQVRGLARQSDQAVHLLGDVQVGGGPPPTAVDQLEAAAGLRAVQAAGRTRPDS